MTKKYPSKVSYGLLIFIFLVFYGPLIPDLINGDLSGKMIGLIGFISLIFAFVLHFFFGTYYIIENNKLKIKCGIFSYKPIEIDKIKEVSKTKNIISSPAPSFDRIEIKYGKFDEIIISPKDKLNFVNDLAIMNPNIKNNITE
jgi:hypothetical protein